MPEHLLNIKEVAQYLGLSEEEVKRLVDMGEIPAYKIGDSFLRFRKEQIDAVKAEVGYFEKKDQNRVDIKLDDKGKPTHPYTEMEKEIKRKEPAAMRYDYSSAERARDFFYYNDFYIVSALIVVILLAIILKS